MIKKNITISIVVPVYNEEDCLDELLNRLIKTLKKIGNYEIILSIDPSIDNTERIATKWAKKNQLIKLIVMSRKFGQPAAVIAGLSKASGEYVGVIDADLQDPPEILYKMYQKILKGYDVISGKRKSRKGETFFKRISTKYGYLIINKTSDVKIPRDVGDFRLMSKKVVSYLNKMSERHGFLRGMVSYVGFKQDIYLYDRDERFSGKGHYNRYLGSLKIALNGLVGYSNFLLNIIAIVGIITLIISLTLIIIIFLAKIFGFDFPLGFPTIVILILLFGAFQLLALSAIGQYIGRIYDEVKQRPRFIIDKMINF